LRRQFAAVFIATGAPEGKGLDIPQGRIKNIISGIDFLRSTDNGESTLLQNVAIIGGGNVAVDCARTCLRRGYRKVTIIYRRTRSEMPAIAREIAEAQKEGVEFIWLASPVRVLVREGKLAGLECIRMRLGGKDASGRNQPVPLKGSEFELKADLVIAAVGEQPDLEFINQNESSLLVRGGLLQADPATLSTGVPGIFAGGDVVTGPATVIDALAAGRKAAVSIDRYLKNQPLEGQENAASPRLESILPQICGVNLPLGSTPLKKIRVASPLTAISTRQNNFAEVEKGFNRSQAEEEASRCLACECRICIKSLGCPAIMDVDGEITIDSGQCSGCGLCAQICPSQAIVRERE
jgi:NADPH-dependent glutamate synthase beta subunit-like oxidoreductase